MSDIALQIERSHGGAVNTGGNVIFDNIVFINGDISYNAATGVMTINKTGRYVFQWWVAIQSSASINGSAFALSSSQGDLLYGNSPLKTDEVSGMGIIEVSFAPVTVSLENSSSAAIYYSTIVPVKASFTVVTDDSGGRKIDNFVYTNESPSDESIPISVGPGASISTPSLAITESCDVLIQATFPFSFILNPFDAFYISYSMGLYRNATPISSQLFIDALNVPTTSFYQARPMNILYVDSPPPGNYVYSYRIYFVVVSEAGSLAYKPTQRTITATVLRQ